MEGYIKIARKIIDSSVFDNPNLLKIWIWILCKSAHKEHSQMIGLQEIHLKKGQLIFGRKKAAEQLKMKESSVYKLIKMLEKMNRITVNSNNKFSLISVVNWELYQEQYTSFLTTEEQQRNNKGTTKEQHRNTNNNVNNVKNVKNKKNNIYAQKNCACEFFDDLWALYPRKRGKASVSKKALQEINAVGFSKMSEAIANYKADIARSNTAEQYIMYGSTFFNGGYKDWLEVHSDEPEIYSDEYMASFGIEIAGQEKPPMRRQ